MRRFIITVAIVLAAAAPCATRAQDEEPPAQGSTEARAEVEAYLEGLLAYERRAFQIGELEAEVSIVPDYFMVVLAREYLKTNAAGRSLDDLRTHYQRLATRSKKLIGRVGVIVKLRHPRSSGSNFYAFQGDIDDHVSVRAMGKIPVGVVAHRGPYERQELTLFKANRSAVFTAGGQCPPVMRRRLVKLTDEQLTVEVVGRRELSDRAKELEVRLGGFIHFSGPGIAGHQVDFENGALATIEPAPEVEVPLPLVAPPVPEALAEVMPTLED